MSLSPEIEVPQFPPGTAYLTCFESWNIILAHETDNANFSTATKRDMTFGFGDPSLGEYFVGGQVLWYLLDSGSFVVRIDMWLQDGGFHFAEFNGVTLLPRGEDFALTLSDYTYGTATAGGMITYHNSSLLAASNHDPTTLECVDEFEGGWWYIEGRVVQSSGGEEDLCFTSHLTSTESMVWAQEDTDGTILDTTFDLQKVVLRVMGHPELTLRNCS